MTKLRIFLLCLLLALTGAQADAALFGSEKKSFDAANDLFAIGVWDRAEIDFSRFVEKYPKSERVAEALLLQAQAAFRQNKFSTVIALLTAHQNDAGAFADQYLYWIAEAQFQSQNYRAAAEAFGNLARGFPASQRRLEAAVGEAAANLRLGEIARVVELLRKAEGAFRQSLLGVKGSELAARGFLVLAEAQLAQTNLAPTNFYDAEFSLKTITAELPPELDWQRRNLLSRSFVGTSRLDDALRESDGMLTVAEAARRWDLLAESVAGQAEIRQRLGQKDKAVETWKRNLTATVPPLRQQEAVARISALLLEQKQFDDAADTLQMFLNQFPSTPVTPLALLTLGEVRLKQHAAILSTNQNGAAALSASNNLPMALANFDRLLANYPNDPLAGKAQLGRGWALWLGNKFPESGAAFQLAAEQLPASEERCVARLKLGDALFAQQNFAGALENYRRALSEAAQFPAANTQLRDPALYQMLRAGVKASNLTGAEEAIRAILRAEPGNAAAARGLLLVAQGYVDANQPAAVQQLFGEFVQTFANSDLRPQVELLLAKVEEQQLAWTNALARYDSWLTQFPTNALRPLVEFQQALATARAGQTASALGLFTNFVAHFRTNDLAARAQWWIADYQFSNGQFAEAELSFKQLFQTWKTSELAFDARLMAGRAALQWSSVQNAIEYFKSLTSDTNCPPDLWASAVLALGGATIRQPTTETNRLAPYLEAAQIFGQVHLKHPNDEFAALAWGEIGNCYFQLATRDPKNYPVASNAYQKAILIPAASVAVRSQAQNGLAQICEQLARAATGDEQKALLLRARDQYLDVALESNLRPGETADEFWMERSGLKAVALLEQMKDWPNQDRDAAVNLCRKLQKLLPVLKPRLDGVIDRLQERPAEKS